MGQVNTEPADESLSFPQSLSEFTISVSLTPTVVRFTIHLEKKTVNTESQQDHVRLRKNSLCALGNRHEREQRNSALVVPIVSSAPGMQQEPTQMSTQNNGRPPLVQYDRNLGACPRIARPYRIREEAYK